MPYLKDDIPLFIMFRALGILTEQEIYEMIMPDYAVIGSNYSNFLLPSVYDARNSSIIVKGESTETTEGIITQELALKYIAEHLSTNYGSTLKLNPQSHNFAMSRKSSVVNSFLTSLN